MPLGFAPMTQPTTASAPEASFWAWFAENEGRLASADPENDLHIFDEVEAQLQRVQEGLTFELELNPEKTGAREFVISGGGDRQLFPTVFSLVKAAPPLKQWKALALKPRRVPDLSLQFDNRIYTVDDYRYQSTPTGKDQLDIVLYVDGFDSDTEEALGSAGYAYLDLLLGEFDVETYLAGIDVLPLPKDNAALKPLQKLVAEVDALKKK